MEHLRVSGFNAGDAASYVCMNPEEAYRLLVKCSKTKPQRLAKRSAALLGCLQERYGFEAGSDMAIRFFNKYLDESL